MSKADNGEDNVRRCYPCDVTDAMWAVIEPLLPARDLRKGGAPRKYDDRLIVNSIFYVLRSGCPWRMLPSDLAPWDAAYRWFVTWRKNGTWERVHDWLRDEVRRHEGRDSEPTAGIVDAQSIKTSEGGEQRGYDAGKKTTGRKRHIIVDVMGLLLAVRVSSASVHDTKGARPILKTVAKKHRLLGLIWADGGYLGTLLNWAYTILGIVIRVVKANTDTSGFTVLPRRWVVERTFGWLVKNRRLARDYERLTANSQAMIHIAMIRLMAIGLAGETIRWSNRQPAHTT